MNAGTPMVEREVIGLTTFAYPASAPALEATKTYAWQVQALEGPRAELGAVKPVGRNNGLSEVYSFRRAKVGIAQQAPPVADASGNPDLLYNAALSGRLVYTFQPNGVGKPRRVAAYLGGASTGHSFELQGQAGQGKAMPGTVATHRRPPPGHRIS